MTPGEQLGPYQILSSIGEGGMGEVWKARDTRLDRVVAIKISKSEFSERFEREARAVAALNHPSICQLYDVGPNYLVFEYIEGQPLKGPVPLDKALAYAAQICDALDAAHKKGITHRDLKPANILVTKSGIKLLDFGLAKIDKPVTVDQTMTVGLTAKGQILGTLTYMSPEQLQGQEADARSDIFSFGCVLYELLIGKRAFDGTSAASLIAAILERPAPSIADVAPPVLDHLLKRCLVKDPDDRWQSIRDIKAELEWIAAKPAADVVPVTRKPRSVWLFVAAGIALAALAASAGYLLRRVPAERMVKLSVEPPEGTSFVSISQGGPIALSPDGRMIAFSAQKPGQDWTLWVRSLDSLQARSLPGTEGAIVPFWSPDSKSLGFGSQGVLKRIDLDSGVAQALTSARSAVGGQPVPNGTWGAGGRILFAPAVLSGLSTVPATGGDATPAVELNRAAGDAAQFWPAFLPDGVHVLYNVRTTSNAHLNYVGALNSKERKLLIKDAANARYAPPHEGYPGQLLYVRNGTLWAQPFNADRLTLDGEPRSLAEHVATTNLGTGGDFSVSSGGTLAWRVGGEPEGELAWFDEKGTSAGAVLKRPGVMLNVKLSPDGKRVALSTNLLDLWLFDILRGVLTRLTFERGSTPVWSPDGAEIAFAREGTGIFRKASNGTGPEDLLWQDAAPVEISDWSADGKYLLLTRGDPKTRSRIWLLPVAGDHKPAPWPQTDADESYGAFAPGIPAPRWVAYQSSESGEPEVYVRTMPGEPAGKWQISSGGGMRPMWSRDGRRLYYLQRDMQTVMAVSIEPGPNFQADQPRVLFKLARAVLGGSGITGDGKRFLFSLSGTAAPAGSISVMLNWQAGLEK